MKKVKIKPLFVFCMDIILAIFVFVYYKIGLLVVSMDQSRFLIISIILYIFVVLLTFIQLIPSYSYDEEKITNNFVIIKYNLSEIKYSDIYMIKFDRFNIKICYYSVNGEKFVLPKSIKNGRKIIVEIHKLILKKNQKVIINRSYEKLVTKYLNDVK